MHAYTKGPQSRCENVSKAIENEGYDARVRLKWASNGLYISEEGQRDMANRNDGHPSCDHGLKHSTSLAYPHWSAPRIGFHLNPSTMQRSGGQLPNEVRSAPIGFELPSRISDQSPDDLQNQVTTL